MKFAIALIKMLSGILSIGIFGAFTFYTYRFIQTHDPLNMQAANVAFILFLFSIMGFALLFIAFEVYQSKSRNEQIMASLVEKITGINENDAANKKNSPLQTLINTVKDTNTLLDNRFEILTNYVNHTNNSALTTNEQLGQAMQQLTQICEQIAAYCNIIKHEKETEADHSGDFAVLIRTLAQLSSDLNGLNGGILDSLNNISNNIKEILTEREKNNNEFEQNIPHQSEQQDNEEIPNTTPAVETPAPLFAEEPQEERESIADIYEEKYNFEPTSEEPIVSEPEPIIEDFVSTNLPQPTEEQINVEPIAEENNFTLSDEPIEEDMNLEAYSTETTSEPAETPSFAADAPFDAPVEPQAEEPTDTTAPLDTIFNDNLASELAELDILKEEHQEEVDLTTLLNDNDSADETPKNQ